MGEPDLLDPGVIRRGIAGEGVYTRAVPGIIPKIRVGPEGFEMRTLIRAFAPRRVG